jgi:aminoglycoside 6'-N-acetyltransferase I
MQILTATSAHLADWAEMRIMLWPWDTVADHAAEARRLYLTDHPDRAAFVALDTENRAIGFAEATLRRDYVEGCDTSPVAFLEGIFVRPEARKRSVGRMLSEAVADWGRQCGCTEFASNALLDNDDSHRFHAALGFAETERVVYFRKKL